MIIVGYPGIGKSSVCGVGSGIIDLESSYFNNHLGDNWERRYVNVAIDLSRQGFIVCTSCHAGVIKQLKEQLKEDKIFIVFPDPRLKEPWLKKLRNRYYTTNKYEHDDWWNEKNYRALKRAEEFFDHDILQLQNSDLNKVMIISMDYDLKQVIENIKEQII